MIKTVIYVPATNNIKRPFAPAKWLLLEQQFTPFGGFSVQRGIGGAWFDGERVYRDRHRAYSVALASIRDLPTWVRLVEWVLEAFQQEALYLELNGSPEILRKQASVESLS